MDDAPPLQPTRGERPWLLMAAAALLLFVATSAQPWWCACGSPALWVGEAASRHTSQHLVDPYAFTHVAHGLLLYALIALGLGERASARARLALALTAEVAWEVLENSPWVIERYRAATISLDYVGDSLANSLGDVLCCALGFLLARRLPLRGSIALVAALELALLATIRDNLSLNLLMLLAPSQGLRAWQQGG